jgi:hypothetical protein
MPNIGSNVLYDGKEYIVIYIYDTGYCEIREKDGSKVDLVQITDLKEISDR